ncbi:MAG: FtsX-like permease family protein [Eubacterium sp.]|nr:FtsX-like permease family protein [Eubacterium sp.]
MEIITLVKAGIRSRKGIMIGFMLLTLLIVVSIITMIGVRKNYETAKDKAYEIEDKGVIMGFFRGEDLTDELREKLRSNDKVASFEEVESLVGTDISVGDKSDGNGYLITKMIDTVPIYNSDETSLIMPGTAKYADAKLKKGEIYLPYGLKSRFSTKVGDKIKISFLGQTKEFTIKGFVQEAYMGSSIVGYKTAFISDEEYDDIYSSVQENIKDIDVDGWSYGNIVYIYPSDKANQSSDRLFRDLTIDTKFGDMCRMAITREESENYTGIYINIMLAVITGFSMLLFAIFLIVAAHNISTEMEIDYANLGIYKSQGFTDRTIRLVYVIEYLFVELVGIILGVILSIPFERWLSRVFFTLTAILPDKNIPLAESAIFSIILFAITFVFIYIFTRKVSKTSPVKAITNGKDDFYFDSRLNAPVRKAGMSFWLGLRQITAVPKRYISIIMVTSLLIFSLISVELMGGFIQSRNALQTMGEPFLDIEYGFKGIPPKGSSEEIEKIVEKYTTIKGRRYKSHIYVTVNGEKLQNEVMAYPNELSSVYKGRGIKYDNEIVITDSVQKLLDIDIGDTVHIGRNEYSADYVVVGLFQTMNDMGKCICMSTDGLSRLKEDPDEKYTADDLSMHGIVLEDASVGESIKKDIEAKYGDDIEVEVHNFEKDAKEFLDVFYVAAEASQLTIYGLSIIFALVTVVMVCTKAFIQERTDLGILRATGFSIGRVRRQFATRFAILCAISSVIGVILGRLFSAKLISFVFSLFGISRVELEYGLSFFVKPCLIFIVIYYVFGYISSRKVKKLSSRELITE